jgi:PAS domain S-box-containing protein
MAAGKKKPDEKDAGATHPKRSLRDDAEKEIARSPKRSPDLAGQTAEELKRAYVALEVSRDKYLNLYDFAPLGYLTLTDKALITDVNLAGATLLGVERSKLVKERFSKFIAEKDSDQWYRYFVNVLNQEGKQICTLMLTRSDGLVFPARLESIRLTAKSDETITVRVAIGDITNIWKDEEKVLQASETRYRRLFETAQDGILILDAETGQIDDVNPFLINLLGFSREQFLGKKIWEIGLFKDIVANKDNFEELQRKEYIRYEDLPLETADGRKIAVEFVSNVYMVNDKKVIQCNIRDITERTKMADQIEASLAEKETLLKEIHHRVKNNLQIITSMLNMQIRKTADPPTVVALQDSQNRVRSMALVHEHLYKGTDLSHINLRNYMSALGNGLFQSYEAANRGIRLDIDIRDIYVGINASVPLGLITNELITNSLKYAFKGKKDGKISITATEDPQALTFVVADNGVGMPEGIMLENQTSLGLRLVSLLIGQIHGTVAIDRTEGTKFTFTIPKPAENQGEV